MPQDYDQAFYWHKLAADQGLAIAQANRETAISWEKAWNRTIAEHCGCKLAAAQGDSSAFYYIGSMYEEGSRL